MNKVEFDVAIFGNHEFNYGIEQLTKLEEKITSKYFCSNFFIEKIKQQYLIPIN